MKTNREILLSFLFESEVVRTGFLLTGGLLSTIPASLRNKELCEITVRRDGRALKEVPENLRKKDPKWFINLCEIAVRQDGRALHDVPKELCEEKPEWFLKLCKMALEQASWYLEDIPKNLRTKEVYEIAVGQNGTILRDVPEELRKKNPEWFLKLCETAVGRNPSMLRYLPQDVCKKNPEWFLKLCETTVGQNGMAFGDIPKNLYENNPEWVLKLCDIAAKQNGNIHDFPKNLRTKERCEIAIKIRGMTLTDVPPSLHTENPWFFEQCEIAAAQQHEVLRIIPQELREKNPEWFLNLCEKTVNREGWGVREIPQSVCIENPLWFYKLCKIAVGQNGRILQRISQNLRTENPEQLLELWEIAVTQNKEVLKDIPTDLSEKNPEWFLNLCKIAIGQNKPTLIKDALISVPDAVLENKEFIDWFVKKMASRVFPFSSELLPFEIKTPLRKEEIQLTKAEEKFTDVIIFSAIEKLRVLIDKVRTEDRNSFFFSKNFSLSPHVLQLWNEYNDPSLTDNARMCSLLDLLKDDSVSTLIEQHELMSKDEIQEALLILENWKNTSLSIENENKPKN
jgi:hypothetical protein